MTDDERLTRIEAQLADLTRLVHGLYDKLDGRSGQPADGPDPRVVAELQAGRKIPAIKFYREATGVGLKEAKDAVDALEAQLGLGGRRGLFR